MIGISACAQHVQTSQAALSPHSWPTPRVSQNDAPPEMLAIDIRPMHVTPGDWWAGKIVTSTNVASLEVRWPFYTFSVPRSAPGKFAFRFHAIDLPIVYRRPYTVEFVARNSAGATTQRNVIIDFR
ncbi:MAG: hypothetical protein JOZ97_01390 [Candidatus Eremiobacteraeota bacterium]|nr:hypothetical protein [Candidatus Eremiobacteraeota bacterium]